MNRHESYKIKKPTIVGFFCVYLVYRASATATFSSKFYNAFRIMVNQGDVTDENWRAITEAT